MSAKAIVSFLWESFYGALEHYLRSRPGTVVIVPRYLKSYQLQPLLERCGCRLALLDEIHDPAGQDFFREQSEGLLAECRTYLGGTEWQARLHGWGVEETTLGEVIDGQLRDEVPTQAAVLYHLEAARRQYDLQLFVTSEDVSLVPNTATLWCRAHGLPSLQLLHGVALSRPYTVHRRLWTDMLALFGERSLESCLDAGIDPNRCRITGNPAWDHYPVVRERRGEIRDSLFTNHRLNPKLPIVTFATTWSANLSAKLSEKLFGQSLSWFFAAVADLKAGGMTVNAVVKGRAVNFNLGENRIAEIAAMCGLGAADYVYVTGKAEEWVVGSDILIGLDSNILVEAMLVETPVINIINDGGVRLGPSFEANAGIVEVEPAALAEAILSLLGDSTHRDTLKRNMALAATRYNHGADGMAGQRVATLMAEMTRSAEVIDQTMPGAAASAVPPAIVQNGPYLWQTFLDIDHLEVEGYHNVVRKPLIDALLTRAPRVVLEIGCGEGRTGEYIKSLYPGARVIGFEPNRKAAGRAKQVLDQVFVELYEVKHLAEAGIEPGSIDTVVVADVLEHMYNPWGAVAELKPYLTPDALIIASIPNIRNLLVMEDLAKGQWRYEAYGLLDITHVRFFTRSDIFRFFQETGYSVQSCVNALDARLLPFYRENQRDKPFRLELEKMILKDVTPDEFRDLCTLQFYVSASPGLAAPGAEKSNAAYTAWLAERRLSEAEARQFDLALPTWEKQPVFHFVIWGGTADDSQLAHTLSDVGHQLYGHYRVSVLSDHPCPDDLDQSGRVCWMHCGDSLAQAVNALPFAAPDEWLVFLNAGDGLESHATLLAARAVNRFPQWQLMYADEDELSERFESTSPIFKPDWNPGLLESMPYMGDFLMVRGDVLARLGGLRDNNGAEFYDLALRLSENGKEIIGHLPYLLFHRHHGATNGEATVRKDEACLTALRLHLTESNRLAEAEAGKVPLTYRIRHRIDVDAPVSILIAARDNLESLQRCLETVIDVTRYPRFEILIGDCQGEDAAYCAYLDGLEALGSDQLRVLRLNRRASLQEVHNLLASQARGEWLVFLYFDSVPLDPDWLEEMVRLAVAERCSAIAPRLLTTDGILRAGGQILGCNGAAESPFGGLKIDDPGYAARAYVVQDFSALPGGCLMVRTDQFASLGGFDETLEDDGIAVAEFGMRLHRIEGRQMWTPHVNVLSPGKAAELGWRSDHEVADALPLQKKEAIERLNEKDLSGLANDPAYNPNLSLREPFAIESARELNWNILDWHPVPRVAVHFADTSGCGHYRMIAPARALSKEGIAQAWSSCLYFSNPELARVQLDSVILQRPFNERHKPIIRTYKKHSNAFIVYEIDDLLTNLPPKSVHHKEITADMIANFKDGVALCDRFVVSTEYLKETYRELHDDIVVVPNYIDWELWKDCRSLRNTSDKPRVGWVGGIGHTGDLEVLVDVVRELAGEVDWIFMGMCIDEFRPYAKEVVSGVEFLKYPARMASLNLDLAVAPLEYHPFNEGKSNLRLLEYGILGIPVICTDILPYQGEFPVCRVENRKDAWVAAIREHIHDHDELHNRGEALHDYVMKNWLLHDHLDQWLRAWIR